MDKIILILLPIILTSSLPSTFDIRYQPHNVLYTNFQPSPDYFCQSYSWAKQLAQIFSNKVSVQMKQKITLSAQHLAECISAENDKCKDATLQNINDAIKFIQKFGLTEEDCYRNRLFEIPSLYCSRKCSNGEDFVRVFKAIVNQEHEKYQLLQSIGNGDVFGFAVVKIYDKMNYYSPDQNQNLKAEGDFYTYRIAQIVGWRKNGEEINLRLGGSGWGYKGYGFVNINSALIINTYSIRMLGYQKKAQE